VDLSYPKSFVPGNENSIELELLFLGTFVLNIKLAWTMELSFPDTVIIIVIKPITWGL